MPHNPPSPPRSLALEQSYWGYMLFDTKYNGAKFLGFVRREGGSYWGEGRPLFHYSRASTIQPPDFEKYSVPTSPFFTPLLYLVRKSVLLGALYLKRWLSFFWPFTREPVFFEFGGRAPSPPGTTWFPSKQSHMNRFSRNPFQMGSLGFNCS